VESTSVRPDPQPSSRREFLKTGAFAAGFPAILSSASIDNAINVGLVGCGGRGTGAAAQAMNADDYAHLTAMADVFPEQIENSLEALRERMGGQGEASAAKIQVEDDKKFLGLDAFQKVIDSDVDVVILTTPPGFRPQHIRRVIEAGKHTFCEKPIATDAPGCRSVLETTEMAAEKNLALVSGFCWRYSNYIVETFDKMHSGAIGDLVSYYATYYTSPVKPMPPLSERPFGMSDAVWQIGNWYNFVWVCGDSLVEQAIHSVDKVAWAKNDVMPVSCVATGGRQIPAEGGNIYDHFAANYLWEDGFRATVANRQIPGCHNENADYIMGSEGVCTIGKGPFPRIQGKENWMFRGEKYDMYQKEHDELFAAIRRGKPINNGKRMTTSTLMGIMGRMAAYTGQEVTWDQALNSQQNLFPENLTWESSLEVRPMALPGVTQLV
jgi:predicted dehydrogenase